MKPMLYLTLASFFSGFFLIAQAQETGTVNRGTYQFTIPEGWVGQYLEGTYLMGSYTEPGMIFLVENTHKNLDDLIREIKSGLTDNYSYDFKLTGEMKTLQNTMVSSDFEGTLEGQQTRGCLTGIVDENLGGLLIIALTTPEEYGPRYPDLTLQIAKSVTVMETPQNLPSMASGPGGNELAQRYTGVKLTYMTSYNSPSYTEGGISGGYSDKEEISLCQSGHFTYNSAYHTSAGGDYSTLYSQSGQRGDGTWSIRQTGPGQGILELRFNDGKTHQYNLEVNQKGETYLNGNRFFRTTGADGPEYAPVCY